MQQFRNLSELQRMIHRESIKYRKEVDEDEKDSGFLRDRL